MKAPTKTKSKAHLATTPKKFPSAATFKTPGAPKKGPLIKKTTKSNGFAGLQPKLVAAGNEKEKGKIPIGVTKKALKGAKAQEQEGSEGKGDEDEDSE